MRITLIFLLLLTSCLSTNRDKTPLKSGEVETREQLRNKLEAAREKEKERLKKEREDLKNKIWGEIVADANETYQPIKKMIQKKCYDCHDANTKLPPYGRIFRSRNPVAKHQKEGLEGLDFSTEFPLRANGKISSSQLSLLKSIKNETLDRTMPLKIYTRFYPKRKIKKKDKKAILNWVDPLIERIEKFEEEFYVDDGTIKSQAKKIFIDSCFRCHANGNHRGDFGDMEKLSELLKNPKYINLDEPEKSLIYTEIIGDTPKMPENPREYLTLEQRETVLLWLKDESLKN